MYVRKVNRVVGVEPRELRCELLNNPISPMRMRLKIIRSLVAFGADRLTLSSLVQHPGI